MKIGLCAALGLASVGCARGPDVDGDVAAARALFIRNIDAIQNKDRDAYLACYRADERLVRAGPEGPKLGFAELAASTSSTAKGWPDELEAKEMELHWLGPGSVYGSYKYRVRFGAEVSEGLSERVFAEHAGRWEIVVSTAFGAPAPRVQPAPIDAILSELTFLSGNWVEVKGDRTTEELWSTARAGTMVGVARTIEGGALASFEHLRIEKLDDAIELVASPGGGAPTRFRLVESGGGAATFENPSHDFPKRIRYKRDGLVLTATAEGDGKTLGWRYERR